MKLTHYWNLFVLLVSSTQLSNGQATFGLQGTSCEGYPVTLGCMISSFASSAEWKRGDGSVLAVTCSSSNLCTLTSVPIDGVTYSFSGNTSGIYMSTTLPVSEHGINWTCTYSGSPYIYQFELGCSEVTTEGSTEGLETSTNFEPSSFIESSSTSTSIFVESNAGISQSNTLHIFSLSSGAENFSSSISTSDRKQTSASFQTGNIESIDTTNALFFMNTTGLIPNSVPSNTSLVRNLDSFKTSMQSSMKETVTISPSTVTIESDYQSTLSYFDTVSLYSETTIGLLTSGVFMITQDKSPGLIYSALDSSLFATTEVCSTNTFKETFSTDIMSTETIIAGMAPTETVSTGMTSYYKMFDIISEVNETTSIIPITDANVLKRYSLSDNVPVVQNTFDSFTTYGSPFRQSMESVITSTAMSIFFTSISEDVGFSSSVRLEAPRSPNTVLTAVEYESQTSQLVYKNNSFSQYFLSNSELSGTSRTIILETGDLSTTPLSYSYVIDTVKHESNFVITSSFNELSISVTQNSFLSSLTIIQTSLIANNEAESTSTERDSYTPTKLFSSMPDDITVSSTYDDKFILLTSTEHVLLVTSSLNTLGSLTSRIENSILKNDSFVKMMSRYSNEFATSSVSLDIFSPKNVKTTTTIQHGLSESSKDDIFISAVSGTIGAFILVFLIAMVISRYFMKRNKFKDEKDYEISNQLGWSDDGGMDSYDKNYTSREYPFNSCINLPLHSYESPYFSNHYKRNWDDNT